MRRRINLLVVALLVALVAMGAAGDSNFTNVVTSGDITAGDDLTVTDDAAVGGNLAVTGTSTVTGATTQTGALTIGDKLTVNDQALIDGDADEIQITVQGHTTQTTSLMVLEQSDGTDVLTVSNDGNTTVVGTLTGTDLATFNGGITAQVGDEHIGLPTWASASIAYTTTTDIFAVTGSETWVVHNVLINVTTNYDCTGDNCTLEIGTGDDTDGFLVLVDAEMQAADTEGTGWAAGWQGQLTGTTGVFLVTNQDFVMDAADGIDLAIGGTDPAAGAATVWINYTRLD